MKTENSLKIGHWFNLSLKVKRIFFLNIFLNFITKIADDGNGPFSTSEVRNIV